MQPVVAGTDIFVTSGWLNNGEIMVYYETGGAEDDFGR